MLVKFTNSGKQIYIEASLIKGLYVSESKTWLQGLGQMIDEDINEAAKRINAAKLLSYPMSPEQARQIIDSADIADMLPYMMFGAAMFGGAMSS